jgi:hypothetical protein
MIALDPSQLWDIGQLQQIKDLNQPMLFGFKVPISDWVTTETEWRAAVQRAQDKVAIEVARKMGGQPHSVQYECHIAPKIDDMPAYQIVTITARVTPVREVIHRMEPFPGIDKSRCRWCGGLTKDDSVGNCAACGAPR